jgi:hypothetical protein
VRSLGPQSATADDDADADALGDATGVEDGELLVDGLALAGALAVGATAVALGLTFGEHAATARSMATAMTPIHRREARRRSGGLSDSIMARSWHTIRNRAVGRGGPARDRALTHHGALGHTPPTHEPLLLLSKPGMMVLGH